MREDRMPVAIMRSEPLEITFGTKSAFDKNVFDDALYPVAKPMSFLDLSWMESFQIPMPSDYKNWHAREEMKRQQDAVEALPMESLRKSAVRLVWWDILMGRTKEAAGERLRQTFGAGKLKAMLDDSGFKGQLKGLLARESFLGGQYYTPLVDDCGKAMKTLRAKRGGLDRLSYVVEGDLCKGCRFRQAAGGGGSACGVFGLPIYKAPPTASQKPELPRVSAYPVTPPPKADPVLHQMLDGGVRGDIFKAVLRTTQASPEEAIRVRDRAAAEVLRQLALGGDMVKAAGEIGRQLAKTASATYDDVLVQALTGVRGVRVAANRLDCADPDQSGIEDALKVLGGKKPVGAVVASQISRNAILTQKKECEGCVFNLATACGKWNLKFPAPKVSLPKAVDPTETYGVAPDAGSRSLDAALADQLGQESRSEKARRVTTLAQAERILSKTNYDFTELLE